MAAMSLNQNYQAPQQIPVAAGNSSISWGNKSSQALNGQTLNFDLWNWSDLHDSLYMNCNSAARVTVHFFHLRQHSPPIAIPLIWEHWCFVQSIWYIQLQFTCMAHLFLSLGQLLSYIYCDCICITRLLFLGTVMLYCFHVETMF